MRHPLLALGRALGLSRPALMDPRLVEVRQARHGRGLFAACELDGGRVLGRMTGRVEPYPTRDSLQLGGDRHLHPEGPELWRLLNHSCRPSIRALPEERIWVTLRPLAQGEELTLNYLSTELELVAPFACRCGSPACFGEIRGFRHLTRAQRASLQPPAAAHLRDSPAARAA